MYIGHLIIVNIIANNNIIHETLDNQGQQLYKMARPTAV